MITAPREELQKQANTTRSRLLTTVDELDRRRHEWADLADRAKRAAIPVAVGAGILLLATAGAVIYGLSKLSRPVSRFARLSSRFARLTSAWKSPAKPRNVGWFSQAFRRALMSALSLLGTYVARRIATGAVPKLSGGDDSSHEITPAEAAHRMRLQSAAQAQSTHVRS